MRLFSLARRLANGRRRDMPPITLLRLPFSADFQSPPGDGFPSSRMPPVFTPRRRRFHISSFFCVAFFAAIRFLLPPLYAACRRRLCCSTESRSARPAMSPMLLEQQLRSDARAAPPRTARQRAASAAQFLRYLERAAFLSCSERHARPMHGKTKVFCAEKMVHIFTCSREWRYARHAAPTTFRRSRDAAAQEASLLHGQADSSLFLLRPGTEGLHTGSQSSPQRFLSA